MCPEKQELNKLVRDRIPTYLRQSGGFFSPRYLEGEELHSALVNKLDEEFAELSADQNLEEAADLFEVALTCLRQDEQDEQFDYTSLGGLISPGEQKDAAPFILETIRKDIGSYKAHHRKEHLISMLLLLYKFSYALGNTTEELDEVRLAKSAAKGGFSTGCYIGTVSYI